MTAPRVRERSILVVDDDRHILEVIEARLLSAGHQPVVATGGEEALALLSRRNFDLVISDIRMPGMDGMTLFERIDRRWPDLPIIFLTAHGSIEGAVEAIKRGAVDYLTKPFDGQELLSKVASVLAKSARREKGEAGRSEPDEVMDLIGRGPAVRELSSIIARVAPREVNVLVLGESGTGKELVAHLIHRGSVRRAGPLVIVDCGSTPAGLLESELFGHVKGAFTHAVKDKKGLMEEAAGGTLFLDEIGNISPEMQIRLLRFLENHKIRRIGDVREFHVDCRVIAATNADIFKAAKAGTFREDLLYRLKVVTINVPPLRERKEDIPLLAAHFVRRFCRLQGMEELAIPEATMAALVGHSWPGNIRELKNALEAGVALSVDGVLDVSGLQLPPAENPVRVEPGGQPLSLENSERAAIVRALEQSAWVQKDAAPLLGISRRALNYKIQKYGIEIPRRRARG